MNKALATGHEVHALVRDPSKLEARDGLTSLSGDAGHIDDVRKLIEGVDTVVSALGNVKKMRIMESAANAILDTAAEQRVPPKCIFVSSLGCGGSSWLIGLILAMINGRKAWSDYQRADARISGEQTVPYVLIRPAALNDKPGNGSYRVFQSDGTFARPMAKEDVAAFLLDAVASNQWDGKGGFQLAGMK